MDPNQQYPDQVPPVAPQQSGPPQFDVHGAYIQQQSTEYAPIPQSYDQDPVGWQQPAQQAGALPGHSIAAAGNQLPQRLSLFTLRQHIIWLIIAIALFMLLGVGLFIAAGVSAVTYDEIVPYSNDEFEIQQPLGWSVLSTGGTYVFLSGTSYATSVAALEVTVVEDVLYGYESTTETQKDEFMKSLLSQYQEQIAIEPPSGFKEITNSSFTIGKHPASARSVSFKLEGVNSANVPTKGGGDVIITKDGEVFILFASAEQNVWDLNTTNFEIILNSFKVR